MERFLKVRLYFLIAMTAVLLPEMLIAQNIIQAEYFIDNDPGVGSATSITITTGATIDENFLAATSGLPSGSYTIYMRTKDDNDVWGFTEARNFIVKSPGDLTPPVVAEIDKMEYFIDDDPGVGAGTDIPLTQGITIDLPALLFNTSTLTEGFHTVGVRSRNTDLVWGFMELRQIFVKDNIGGSTPAVYDVEEIEYFIDDDPGVGLANKWPAFASTALADLSDVLPETNALPSGQHVLVLRAKNTNGEWGLYERRQILIKQNNTAAPAIPNITKLEYFFDGNDPGVGNAAVLAITPSTLIDLAAADVPTPPTLIDGPHTITMRALDENGMWSMAEESTFDVLDDCIQPIAGFTPQIACANQPVTFIDTSTSLQADAQYRWYLDGDNLVDDTSTGDVTHTYTQPGDYVVALAIRQGTICLDSTSTTITIKELPVVVFSATGTATGLPTVFEASTANLDPAATWSWDFETDGTADDTTPDITSHTYTVDGSYDASLTVSDGLGCSVTTTKTISVSAGGTGASPPSADFLAADGCVGAPIQFTDLSQNLPTGSIYSWDFDGDGTEDSATPGVVQHNFAIAGTYTANLTIDVGGSTIQSSKSINIVDVPVADFSAIDACTGQTTDFTDLSSSVAGGAIYMWDFDNDGIVDSNAATGVSFTYSGPGTFIASLTVNNGAGCSSTIVKQAQVIATPTASFTNSITCTNEVVNFNDISTDINTGAIYSWNFDGDGLEDDNTAGDVSYTFSANGSYSTTLTITNDPGCTNTFTKVIEVKDRPNPAIDVVAKCYGQESQMIDLSTNIDPAAVYSWDFDNNGTEDDQTAGSTVFTYPVYNSYVVKLNIDNGGGCVAETEELVVFSDAALPDFSFGTTCEDVEVIFTDLSTSLATGATYSWDFDNNGLADSQFPGSTAFTFGDAGIYNATLTIDNGGQCLAYKTIPVTVTAPPAVSLGPDVFLCNDSTVVLDAGTGYSSYFWAKDSTNQTYTIDQVGKYSVTVTDAKSCQNSDTIRVAYLGDPEPSFEYSYRLSLDGVYVNFTNTTINGSAYQWDFGDGTPPIFDESPIHLYEEYFFYKNTFYEVTMTATNDCGRQIETKQTISLSPTALSEDPEGVAVYPNPASDILVVELTDLRAKPIQLQLFDPQGKSVWRLNQPDMYTEVDVSALQKGVYILVMVREEGLLYRNVVIK